MNFWISRLYKVTIKHLITDRTRLQGFSTAKSYALKIGPIKCVGGRLIFDWSKVWQCELRGAPLLVKLPKTVYSVLFKCSKKSIQGFISRTFCFIIPLGIFIKTEIFERHDSYCMIHIVWNPTLEVIFLGQWRFRWKFFLITNLFGSVDRK